MVNPHNNRKTTFSFQVFFKNTQILIVKPSRWHTMTYSMVYIIINTYNYILIDNGYKILYSRQDQLFRYREQTPNALP